MICIINTGSNKDILRTSTISTKECEETLKAVSILLDKARETIDEMEEGIVRNCDEAREIYLDAIENKDVERIQVECKKIGMCSITKEQVKAMKGRIIDAIESVKNVDIRLV